MSDHAAHPGADEPGDDDVQPDFDVQPDSDAPPDSDESGAAAEAPTQGVPAPETGDLVIDAALRDLAEAPEDDLDAQVERGEQVQRTLQGRLSDLGG